MVKPSTVVQKDAPVLRKIAKEVPLANIRTPQIQNLVKNMQSALASEAYGVAIAAPQIGVSARVFVVSGNIFAKRDTAGNISTHHPDMIFINPVITARSRKKVLLDEGCLSVRGYRGKIYRHEEVSLSALDETGEKISLKAKGLVAQIFQHETDHLNGILYIDKAEEVAADTPHNNE